MRIYIVDDKQSDIETLVFTIKDIPDIVIVGSSTDPNKALDEISSGKVKADITLLDIEMPEMSGRELAGLICSQTTIIFLTGYDHYAAKAFDDDIAVDYIVKPASPDRITQGFAKAKMRMEILKQKFIGSEEDDYFFLKMDGKSRYIKILKNDILYIEGATNYVYVQMGDHRYLSHFSMTALEGILPSKHFYRIAKSYTVNLQKIERINGFDLEMSNGVHLTVGKAYRRQFFERLNSGSRI